MDKELRSTLSLFHTIYRYLTITPVAGLLAMRCSIAMLSSTKDRISFPTSTFSRDVRPSTGRIRYYNSSGLEGICFGIRGAWVLLLDSSDMVQASGPIRHGHCQMLHSPYSSTVYSSNILFRTLFPRFSGWNLE
jgi:hypothetical protein